MHFQRRQFLQFATLAVASSTVPKVGLTQAYPSRPVHLIGGCALNWKLLSGSHKFPGPDGGTCLNEAAVVAAGFEYRAVQTASDCPLCFSRPIAAYAIGLNDSMPDDLRQQLLMPFVTRLAGTADTSAKEIERTSYIAIQTIRRILPISLRAIGLYEHADWCAKASELNAAIAAAAAAVAATRRYDNAAAAVAAATSAAAGHASATSAAAGYAAAAAEAAGYAAAREEIFLIAAAIFDEAIRLGNQAEPIETVLVARRMEAIKQRASAERRRSIVAELVA
jgi:hypothetical protein